MELAIFPPRKQSKSRLCCAVNGCQSKTTKDLNLVFHSLPKRGACKIHIKDELGNVEQVDKFEIWKNRLKLKRITSYQKVCSLHFTKSDYIFPDVQSQRRNLKKTAVPSCNLPRSFKATDNVKNKRKFEKNNRLKIVKNTRTSTDNSALKTVKNQVIEVDSERNKTASEQTETMFYKSDHMHFLVSETNFANTGIESCEILENDTKLSNHEAQHLFLIENEDIKIEPADIELTNENEQIKSDILDREFIIKQENPKCEEILHTEITIKEENIDIEPELSTKSTTAGENIKFDQEIHTEVIIKEEFFFPPV